MSRMSKAKHVQFIYSLVDGQGDGKWGVYLEVIVVLGRYEFTGRHVIDGRDGSHRHYQVQAFSVILFAS